MFKPQKHPFPRTTEECKMLLETVLEKADSSLLSDQKAALKALERLCEKQCTKSLTYIMRSLVGALFPSSKTLPTKLENAYRLVFKASGSKRLRREAYGLLFSH